MSCVELWMTLRCVTAKHVALTVTIVDAACLAITQLNVIHNNLLQEILAVLQGMSRLDSFAETKCAMHVPSPQPDKPDSVVCIAICICIPVRVQCL